MQWNPVTLVSVLAGAVLGAALLFGAWFTSRRTLARARDEAGRRLAEAEQDAESRKREILLAAQESQLALQEETDRRERELDEREAALDEKARAVQRDSGTLGRDRKKLERQLDDSGRREKNAREAEAASRALRDEAQTQLERVAGLSAQDARAELIASIEGKARAEAGRLARKIQDEARETADREAVRMMIQASQRVNIRDVLESTVSFIELPSDEMKGRIIGREGRNIRALEMATGIDLVVDDTPRSILISSFDPVRREIARVAIDRLVEDGRIHPARIEEVVQKVREEMDSIVEQKGAEAAYSLAISDLHPKLTRRVGHMRYHTIHGQNLLQHCLETAIIAGHMAREIGAEVQVVQRAGLLHEIGQIEDSAASHPILVAAELAGKHGESDDVVHAIRSLQRDVEPRTIPAILLNIANRMSAARPGARKENLAVFIERLKRLEAIATGFSAVDRAYAVKSGKEIRVIVDAKKATDEQAYKLCKQIARTIERDLSYPGQIKVNVVRETRAVRFAL